MSFHKLGYFDSLWYIAPNLCSFSSNRPRNCLYFEVTDSHHRHILGLGNLSNHLDNWCYKGSLNFYVKNNLLKIFTVQWCFLLVYRWYNQSMFDHIQEDSWYLSKIKYNRCNSVRTDLRTYHQALHPWKRYSEKL